ncbi:recombinase RecB [Xylanimonas allomyrinae]|uniref:Recombinase RecB n=1 Tax=Xylanimonas allomyrinae TaxID=2509459 RepID=A0A4P6EQK5_9MICO|nr:ribonuclease H-like domain-containing protein [Xylanimonas allomyrinae]QAY62577.1 recombinase RecB [Xylanimonas allomyrinae]
MPSAEIVLGGYPAKNCARAVHNDFSPASPPKPPLDEATQLLLGEGVAFEEHVNARLARTSGAVLLGDENGWDANREATLAAMRDGVAVIVNGRLPDVGPRTGAPDVLVRIGDGYVPVDVKNNGTRAEAKTRSAIVSTVDAPADLHPVAGLSDSGTHREDEGVQLAHYTRMLQDLGFHAGDEHLIGGIIGNSDFTPEGGDPWLIRWYDLTTPFKATYSASASAGRAKRSLLDRYDHEFAFRLKVAHAARSGKELVRPFHVSECGACAWSSYCHQVAGPDDASFAIDTGLPTAQQWRHLRDAHQITTLTDLSALDPATCTGWDARDTQPGTRAQRKLATLVRRAGMTTAGVEIEPLDAWPEIPSADVEVDFDIEWDLDGRIYLWGVRIREGQDDATAVFDPVVSYVPLDDDGARALAVEFAAKVEALAASAAAEGKALQIYHWTSPEVSRTFKYAEVRAALEGRTFDLEAWLRASFLTRRGTSIKVVAPLFGFSWSVDDAGGLQSQTHIETARGDDPDAAAASRAWLHAYNQSDVAAQAAIRDGLRAAKSGDGASRSCPAAQR